MISTTYIVLTPRGQFLAEWDEDEEIPVQYAGDPVAIAYFYDYMALEMVTGRGGLRLEPGYIEPDELYGFCQSDKYGITVIPDTPPTPDDEGDDMQELDAATPEERQQLIQNGREIVGRLSDSSPSFFVDARALQAITAELSESDATLLPRVEAIAQALGTLGWTRTRISGGVAMASPRNAVNEVIVREDDTYPGSVEIEGSYVSDSANDPAEKTAAEIDRDDFLAASGLHSEDGETIDHEGHDMHGKTVAFAYACDALERAVKANGGQIMWGDFAASLSSGALFDGVAQYGVTAQIGKDNRVLARAELSEAGLVTLYRGAAGSEVAATAETKAQIASSVNALFASQQAPAPSAPESTTPGRAFSIQDVADAMKKTKGWDSAWWQDASIDAPLRFAQAQGWVRRPSTTQVEWTDAGVAAMNSASAQAEPGAGPDDAGEVTKPDEAPANPDQALLQSVIDGTADMASPALLDQLEAAYERIKDDPAMMALFNQAAEAYSAYAIQAAKSALNQ